MTSESRNRPIHHHHHHHHYYNGPNDPNNTDSARRVIENNTSTSQSSNLRKKQSSSSSLPLFQAYSSIKTLSLSHLTAKQHFLMAFCRDVSLLPPIVYLFNSMKKFWDISIDSNVPFNDLQTTFSLIWSTYLLNNWNNSTITTTTLKTPIPTSIASTILSSNTNNNDNKSSILTSLITARASEYILCAIWCIVSLYLTYAILDSLMVRWIVKYSTLAAIVRMLSMSLMLVTLELLLLASFSPQSDYYLHTWILISCILTAGFIWQNYLTSNLNIVTSDEPDDELNELLSSTSSSNDDSANPDSTQNDIVQALRRKDKKKSKKTFKLSKKRTIDLYNIIVFCVVPVGLASFITMIGLLRNLFIQRLDVERLGLMIQESYSTSH